MLRILCDRKCHIIIITILQLLGITGKIYFGQKNSSPHGKSSMRHCTTASKELQQERFNIKEIRFTSASKHSPL